MKSIALQMARANKNYMYARVTVVRFSRSRCLHKLVSFASSGISK